MEQATDGDTGDRRERLCDLLQGLQKTKTRGKTVDIAFPYDGGEDVETSTGAVLLALRGLPDKKKTEAIAEAVTDGDDAGSFRHARLGLAEHLRQVEMMAREFARGVGLSPRLAETVAFAARFHDRGKADPRFQIYLAGGEEPTTGLLAKSGQSFGREIAVRLASGLPKG